MRGGGDATRWDGGTTSGDAVATSGDAVATRGDAAPADVVISGRAVGDIPLPATGLVGAAPAGDRLDPVSSAARAGTG